MQFHAGTTIYSAHAPSFSPAMNETLFPNKLHPFKPLP